MPKLYRQRHAVAVTVHRRGRKSGPRRECICSPFQISRYLAKIAGPLLERIESGHIAEAVQYRALDRAYFQGQ